MIDIFKEINNNANNLISNKLLFKINKLGNRISNKKSTSYINNIKNNNLGNNKFWINNIIIARDLNFSPLLFKSREYSKRQKWGDIRVSCYSRRFLLFGLFSLMVILLFMQNVFALGITPGRNTLDYAPGGIQDYEFEVVNSQHEDIEIVVLVQGELNESVSVSEVSFKMSKDEESKKISYTLTMPSGLKPGLHTAEIVALQLPGKSKEKGTFIGAAVGVTTQVHINVPYPGKYLETSLDIIPSGDGEMRFIVPAISRGELDIVRAKAVIDIYTSLNEKINTVTTDAFVIKELDR